MITSIENWKAFRESNEYSDYITKMVTKELGDLDDVQFRIETTDKFIDKIKELSNPFIGYRLYQLDNNEVINYDKIGNHFIIDKNIITQDWLNSVGNLNKDKLVLLNVEIYKNDINWYRTIQQNAHYPNEGEVFVNPTAKINVIDEEQITL